MKTPQDKKHSGNGMESSHYLFLPLFCILLKYSFFLITLGNKVPMNTYKNEKNSRKQKQKLVLQAAEVMTSYNLRKEFPKQGLPQQVRANIYVKTKNQNDVRSRKYLTSINLRT